MDSQGKMATYNCKSKEFKSKGKTHFNVNRAVWNYKKTKVLLICDQQVWCLRISDHSQTIMVQSQFTAGPIFDSDGLAYIGNAQGEVHIFDQHTCEEFGAKKLVIQGA